jgi:hypothetical protein
MASHGQTSDLAAHAPLDIDLAPTLQIVELVKLLHLEDAVNRADLQARLAAGAIIGVDDGQFLGQLFAGTCFCHGGFDRLKGRVD